MAGKAIQDLCSHCLKDENLQESLPCGHILCTECLEIPSTDEAQAELEKAQCPVCAESSNVDTMGHSPTDVDITDHSPTDVDITDRSPIEYVDIIDKLQTDVDIKENSPTDVESADEEDKMCRDHWDQKLTHCCVTCYLSVCERCIEHLDSDICFHNEQHTFKKPTKRILSTVVEKHEGYTASIHNEERKCSEILKKVDKIQERLLTERQNIEEAVDKRAELLTEEIARWALLSKTGVQCQVDEAQRHIDDYRRDIEVQKKEFSLRNAKLSHLSDRLQNGDFYSLPAFLNETVKSKQAIIDSYAETEHRAKAPSGECKLYLNEEIHFIEPLDVPYVEAGMDYVHFGGFRMHSSSHICRFEAILADGDEPDQACAASVKKIEILHVHSFVLKDWATSGLTTNQDDEVIVTNSRKNLVCVFNEDGRVKAIFPLDTGNCDGEAKPVVALPDGSVAVGEFNSNSFLVFKQGKRCNPDVIRSKDITECRDITCDAEGQIIVACKSKLSMSKKEEFCGKVEIHDGNKNSNVLTYSAENDSKIYFSEPTSVAVNKLTNEIILADSERKEVIGIRKDGTHSFVYSCPDPRAVCCDAEGRVFVLNAGNDGDGGSIHIVADDGKTLLSKIPLTRFKPFNPPPSFIDVNDRGKLFLANETNVVKVFKYQFQDDCPSEA